MNQFLSAYLILVFLVHGFFFTVWSKNSWVDVGVKFFFGLSGLVALFLASQYIGILTVVWNN